MLCSKSKVHDSSIEPDEKRNIRGVKLVRANEIGRSLSSLRDDACDKQQLS